jgi:hypothetical protein
MFSIEYGFNCLVDERFFTKKYKKSIVYTKQSDFLKIKQYIVYPLIKLPVEK